MVARLLRFGSRNITANKLKDSVEIFCDLILLKYFSAQTLVGTEIERNDVKADSPDILVIWKGWINHLVTFILKIPDFSLSTTKIFLSGKIIPIIKINLPASCKTANDHGFAVQCD